MKGINELKKTIKSIICILVSMAYLANCMVVQADVETVTLSGSKVEEYKNNTCIYANITNIQSGSKQIVSKIDILDKKETDVLDGIMYNIGDDAIISDNLQASNDAYFNEVSVYSAGDANIYSGTCNIQKTIVSEESINIGTSKITGENMVLCSKNENISINASDIELQGIIYAPNGKVSINGDSILFDGIIIADTVEIFGRSITLINSNSGLFSSLRNCKMSNMTSFSMYYSNEDGKIGVSYDKEYKRIDLYYRYDEENFQCILNYDLNNHLDVPRESGYLEGYVVVVDKFGYETVSNIVTFYNDGNCYEVFKDSDSDGIGDAYEIRDLKTNPYSSDTDEDGIIDAYDIYEEKNGQNYEVKIILDKEIYEEISAKVCDMYYVDEVESTEEIKVCYLKKSVTDVEESAYNSNGILITTVYNKITGNIILEYYEDKYTQYIYNNKEQRLAILAHDGKNNTINMYSYDENGNVTSIFHNGFIYELTYNKENISQISIAGSPYINYEYDNEGHMVKAIFGNGYLSNIEYDEIGNVLKISDNEKILYEWTYGEYYMLNSYKDYVNDNIIYYYYGDEGQIERIEDNKGRSIEYVYEPEKIQKKFTAGNKEHVNEFFIEDTGSRFTIDNILSISALAYNSGEEKIYCYEGKNILTIKKRVEKNCIIKNVGADEYKYVFADNGNLMEEYINGELISSYEYNNFSQMTRVNSGKQNLTIVYEYDAGGNITIIKYYKLSFEIKTEALMEEIETVSYKYTSKWRDLLTEYNGEHIEYDDIGNPISYIKGINYEWKQGRDLCKISNENGEIASYAYNSDGIRTKKVIGDKTIEYYIEGNNVIYEKGEDYEIYYIYDADSEITGFEYNDSIFIYKKNGLKDVIGIIDLQGNEIASYEYDSWGKITKIAGNMEIARINPFRYKSYYYDEESGLYYLNSRYYDAATGRFINADKHIETYVGIHSNNMFAYCENAPVVRLNSTGEASVGVANSISSYSSGYVPKYNTLYSWIPETMRRFNCYAFVLNDNSKFIMPGEVSGKKFKLNLDVIVANAIEDMKKKGFKNVREINWAYVPQAIKKEVVVAVRIGVDDFHWIRYCNYASGWLHKPGDSAIIKLKGYPSYYSIWEDERYDGYWWCTDTTYTSTVRYIAFN